MTLSLTSSVESRSSDSVSASTEPCTSALRMSRSSLTSPDWICLCRPSRVMRVARLALELVALGCAWSAICRALRSSETDHQHVAGLRHAGQPEDLDGIRRARPSCTFLPAVVDERADAAGVRADHDGVALLAACPFWMSAVATGPRPRSSRPSMMTPARGPARVGLAARAPRPAARSSRAAGRCRRPAWPRWARRSSGRPTPRARGSWLASSRFTRSGSDSGLVDLVDGHDDRHVGRPGVVDGLHGLRHHAVVGGHHQDDDVGGLGAARAHRGERLVARRVEERDLAVAASSTW